MTAGYGVGPCSARDPRSEAYAHDPRGGLITGTIEVVVVKAHFRLSAAKLNAPRSERIENRPPSCRFIVA